MSRNLGADSRSFDVVVAVSGVALKTGDVVTGTDIDNLAVENGYIKVTLEISAIPEQRGACHLYAWDGAAYARTIGADYGDYTYFTNTPHARPDRVTVIESTEDHCELAVEWDAYTLVDAGTFPNGIAYRDWGNALNYAQGQSNPNWKYITATRLTKTVIVDRGLDGYFTGYHSDPRVGPLGINIPADNNDAQSWGEREMGVGGSSQVTFSSAGVAVHHPVASGTHSGLGIDDPVAFGGAEQTTGPWWAASLPYAGSSVEGFCRYIALRGRLQILAYQFGAGQYGYMIINGVNEMHDDANVPCRAVIFIGAFVHEVTDFAAEPSGSLRGTLDRKAAALRWP